jgi:hypothetical protein
MIDLPRIAQALEAGQALDPADAAALLVGIAAGSVDFALGLKPAPGARSAASKLAQARRDRLIRGMAAEFYATLPSDSERAEHISLRLSRYRLGSDWERDRAEDSIKYIGSLRGRCWEILKQVDRPLSARRIRAILAAS